MNKLCKGCSAQTGNAEECILEPEYNNETCPCVKCLVKSICSKDYHTCSEYKEFCDIQLPNQTKPEDKIPCFDCINYDKCQAIVKEMAEELVLEYQVDIDGGYVLFKDTIVDENVDSLFVDIMIRLQRFCPKLDNYYSFTVVSRDNATRPCIYRHNILTQDELEERESDLFELWDCYKLIRDQLPDDEEGLID